MTAAIQFKNGNILIIDGKIAMDPVCCTAFCCDGCMNKEWGVNLGGGGWATPDPPTCGDVFNCAEASGTFVVTNYSNLCCWWFLSEDGVLLILVWWDGVSSRLLAEITASCGLITGTPCDNPAIPGPITDAAYQSAVYDHCSNVPTEVELTKFVEGGELCDGTLPSTITVTKL